MKKNNFNGEKEPLHNLRRLYLYQNMLSVHGKVRCQHFYQGLYGQATFQMMKEELYECPCPLTLSLSLCPLRLVKSQPSFYATVAIHIFTLC